MVWLALLGLTIWLIVQQSNLGDLKRELAQLRRLLAESAKPPPAAASGITPAMEAAARAAAESTARDASASTPPVLADPRPPAPVAEPARLIKVAQVAAPPSPLAPALTRAVFERWMAEKGLAWIGGSA